MPALVAPSHFVRRCALRAGFRAHRVHVLAPYWYEEPEPPLPEEPGLVLVASLGLEGSVELAGFLAWERLSELYRRCAFVLVPSLTRESFGLGGVQALAHAKPVVAFDTGAHREWLEHGVSGYLAEPGRVDCLAEYTARLLASAQLRREMGRAGHVRCAQHFPRDLHIEHLLQVYNAASRWHQPRWFME